MKKKDNGLLWILVIVVVFILLKYKSIFFAFEDPLLNTMPNNEVSEWTGALPTGWTTGGWSHATGWRDLTQSTTYRSGPYSVGFINKGYDGTPYNTPCDDWCMWYSARAPVTPQTITHARFYFNPVSFQRISSAGDGVRISLIYYNSTGSEISVVGGPTLVESNFANPGTWNEITLEGISPANAVTAAIKFTFATRTTDGVNTFLASFYVDDLWIESSDCTENWVCTDYTYCTGGYQARTCTDTNACGTTFNKPTQSRACEAPIEKHISDYKSNAINIVSLLQEIGLWRESYITNIQLEAMFNVARYRDRGDGINYYSWHRSEPYMGWEDATAIHSMLTMYEATKKTSYLDMAIMYLDYEISLWPFEGGNWGTYSDTTPDRPSQDRASGGNLIENFVKFAYIIDRDGLVQYDVKAQDYYNFANENFLQYWNRDTRIFQLDGVEMGCIADNGQAATWGCDRWNAAAQVATSLLYASLYQPNDQYRSNAIRMATFFKQKGLHYQDSCAGSGPTYSWAYRYFTGLPGDSNVNAWGQYENGHREEIHYSNYDVRMMYDFWEQGLVYNDQDMEMIARTYVNNMWNRDYGEPYTQSQVDCWSYTQYTDMHRGFETGYIQSWAYYNEFNPTMKAITERISKKLYDDSVAHNNFWSSYYTCIWQPVGLSCYQADTRTQPEMQMSAIASILKARKELNE